MPGSVLGGALTLAAAVLAACGSGTRPVDEPAPPATTVAEARVAAKVDVAAACAPLRPEPTNPVLGALPRMAAPLVGSDVDGRPFDLADLAGKVVVVSFSANWDGLTKQERPTFAALRAAIGDDLVIVRVISESSLEAAAKDYQASDGYPTVFDEERRCSALGHITNGWGVTRVPDSFLVDRAGNVRFYFVNQRDWSTPEAVACVRALVADTTPPIADLPQGAGEPEECPEVPPPPPPPPLASGENGVSGTVTFARAVKRKARPGTIFIYVKRADASGQPTGAPIAVDRLAYDGKALRFVLDETKQLIAGPQVTGDVVVVARWDQDGEAMSKQPGDITGTVRVTAPKRGVKLVLDTVLP